MAALVTDLRSYSFVVLLASLFACVNCSVAQTVRRAEIGEVNVQGYVVATDSCQLAPASWSGVCAAQVVPIEGELRLRKRGTLRRTTVELNTSGVFTERLEPGAYRVRLIEPRIAERPLKRSAYRIYPPQVRIRSATQGGVRLNSQANIFLVAHKSRGAPPSVAISDGFTKGVTTPQ